ncbi:MAG: hypothetical protein ACI3XJ_12730 [Oscillospiraceae bacterium]
MAIKKVQKNRMNESGEYDQIYYQTSADQVLMNDGTTAEEKIASKADLVNGKVPVDQVPDEVGDMNASVYDPQGKKTDVFKYVDDAMEAGKEVFIATYEETTNDEIYQAHQDGKVIFVDVGETCAYLPLVYVTDVEAYFGSCWDGNRLKCVGCDSGFWWTDDFVAETTDHRVSSLSARNTHFQYPSAKAVYDALTAKQDTLTGNEGQVVGFGADGKPVAQDAPTVPDKLSDLTDDTTHRVVTDEEKTAWSAKADKPKVISVTLTVAGWADGVQTVTVAGVLTDETKQNVRISIADRASSKAWADANVWCDTPGADSLIFSCETVPAADINLNVELQEVAA